MAQDANGTPTSPDSIPKYNTATDSPSGRGFNAAMDAIQTALSNRLSAPAGIAGGEVPVWDAVTGKWVRSTVQNIGPTSLGSGSPDATKFLRGDGAWAVPVSNASYACVRDEKVSGTDGGTGAAVTWNVRTLNTEHSDVDGILTLIANQVTLLAGTYLVRGHAPVYHGAAGNRHKLRLRNVTDGATVLVGTSSYCEGNQEDSLIEGRFTIAAGKALELQHYTQSLTSTNGLGVSSSSGEIEVYAVLEFWKMP